MKTLKKLFIINLILTFFNSSPVIFYNKSGSNLLLFFNNEQICLENGNYIDMDLKNLEGDSRELEVKRVEQIHSLCIPLSDFSSDIIIMINQKMSVYQVSSKELNVNNKADIKNILEKIK